MAENETQHDGGHDDGHHVDYKKIYFILLALLVVSVAGPFLEILWVTLITAFGIAIVKANLVIQNFMHLRWEKRLMKWMLSTSLLLMFLMVAGIAPDVLNHEGRNWENLAAKAAVERGISAYGHDEEEHDEEEAGEEVAAAPAQAGFNVAASYAQICASCHGAAGAGDGAAGQMLDPAPANFTDPAFWEGRDDARIKQVIRDGAASVGGSVLMAPWGALYDDEQLDAMVEYVKSFRPEGNQ